MLKTYKFRLYPNKLQEKELLNTLNLCRITYNLLLSELNKEARPNRVLLQNRLPLLNKKEAQLNKVYSKTLQYEAYRLFSNLKSLAMLKKRGKKVGKLRFKQEGSFKTFTYNQSGFRLKTLPQRHHRLALSKIGDIPIRIHRDIEGVIKQVTIKHACSKKWFALMAVEYPNKELARLSKPNVGIDLGLANLIYDSDGNIISHPKYLEKSLVRLMVAQQKLCRKKKGSSNQVKQRIKVAKIYERILNQRDDYLHKASREYVNNYGLIAIENLNITKIITKSHNARNIMDASWRKFISMLEYKAESAGVQIKRVDARGTSQICSSCGKIVPKKLCTRTHKCDCGLEINRDYNAAKNILARALGQELSDFKPAESEPLSLRHVRSEKQEICNVSCK